MRRDGPRITGTALQARSSGDRADCRAAASIRCCRGAAGFGAVAGSVAGCVLRAVSHPAGKRIRIGSARRQRVRTLDRDAARLCARLFGNGARHREVGVGRCERPVKRQKRAFSGHGVMPANDPYQTSVVAGRTGRIRPITATRRARSLMSASYPIRIEARCRRHRKR
jgi:hypothetical protein